MIGPPHRRHQPGDIVGHPGGGLGVGQQHAGDAPFGIGSQRRTERFGLHGPVPCRRQPLHVQAEIGGHRPPR